MSGVSAAEFFDGSEAALAGDAVAEHNALVGRAGGFPLTVDGIALTIRLQLEEPEFDDWAAWAEFARGEGRFRVALARIDFLPTLRGAISEAPMPEALPEDLLAAVIETLIEPAASPPVELIQAGFGRPPVNDDEAGLRRFGLEVAGAEGERLTRGRIECDGAFANWLAELERPPVGDQNLPRPDAVGRVQLRSVWVPLEEFERLEPRDILVLGAYGLGGRLPARIYFAPGLYFVGTLDGEVLKMEPEEKQGPPAEEETSSEPAPVNVDKLPVRVSFELGSVTVSFGDLKGMAEGQVLELPVPLDTPVTLRANGREIGKGALMRIEDHVGVRIVSLRRE